MKKIRSLLVANRSEIAIRVMRAASEMGIRTVGIYANEDRFALHRFKADESYLVGEGKKPIAAYLDIDDIIRVAKEAKSTPSIPATASCPKIPDFADACAAAGIAFIGPKPEVMRTWATRWRRAPLAVARGCRWCRPPAPCPTTPRPPRLWLAVGYPLMLKASWGGGGRGMRVIETEADLAPMRWRGARPLAAFGNDEVYLEKLVRRARHVEVQVLGDTHGNLVHLFERDCSVQRRNQKVVERAPAPYWTTPRAELCESALKLWPPGRLHPCRHRRVPDGRGQRQVLLHRGQPAHPGRAHGHRGSHRRRHRQGADPRHRGCAHRRRRTRSFRAGRTSACVATPAMPRHHRRPGK
jgi:pyruvate carboxylase